jgi:hypothetical protein
VELNSLTAILSGECPNKVLIPILRIIDKLYYLLKNNNFFTSDNIINIKKHFREFSQKCEVHLSL